MRNINLFVEDVGHEEFCQALINRFAKQYGIEVKITLKNTRGGHGKVIREIKQYIRDLHRSKERLPDLILIATDSNCQKLLQRKQEIEHNIPAPYQKLIVYMIPEPHLERWLLLDGAAFKKVFGAGCDAPDLKCERSRYKRQFIDALMKVVLEADPLVVGYQNTPALVNAMDFDHIQDRSLNQVIQDLTHIFKQWSQT